MQRGTALRISRVQHQRLSAEQEMAAMHLMLKGDREEPGLSAHEVHMRTPVLLQVRTNQVQLPSVQRG